ncbi:MAG: hypothetical protein KF901_27405 [Myxococcales bacterium]|nr:hypothetical protein [Myxococcales bacterium]
MAPALRAIVGGLLALVALSACHTARPTTVVRVLGGERRPGPFVSPYAYEHFLRAELAAARGDDEAAIEGYARARLGPSDDALVAARLAEAFDRVGRVERADATLAEAEALDPESEAVALARSRIAERRGDGDGALDAAVTAVERAPESDAALGRLGELLARRGASSRALVVLRRVSGHPGAARARLTLALTLGDPIAAEEALEALSRLVPTRQAEVEAAVRLALDGGRPALAAYLARRPGVDAALRLRAELAAGLQDEVEGALRVTPSDELGGAAAHAELYLAVDRPDLAAPLAESALALGEVEARVSLARARLALGDVSGALEVIAQIPSESADRAESTRLLADALARAGMSGLAAEIAPR